MPLIYSLRNQKDFDLIKQKASKFVGKRVIIYMANLSNINLAHQSRKDISDNALLLGMKVSKKYGKAVARNLLKRRIRAIFRELSITCYGFGFIVIPKLSKDEINYEDLKLDIIKMQSKLTREKNEL